MTQVLQFGAGKGHFERGRGQGLPLGVVGVFVASKTAVHRLPEQGYQLVPYVSTAATFVKVSGCSLRKSKDIIHLTAYQESSV